MAHDDHHHHPIKIDPSELSPGSVLVTVDPAMDALPVVATGRAVVRADIHEGIEGAGGAVSPIEYVLSGLALSLAQVLKLVVLQRNFPVHQIFVAASQQRDGLNTKITREIIIDGPLKETDREVLMKAAGNCPVQKILNGDVSIENILA